jgi:hypothetical protein
VRLVEKIGAGVESFNSEPVGPDGSAVCHR